MRRNVRKWMVASLVMLAAAPALAGCVATVGPDYYHRHCCWRDYGWHHPYWR